MIVNYLSEGVKITAKTFYTFLFMLLRQKAEYDCLHTSRKKSIHSSQTQTVSAAECHLGHGNKLRFFCALTTKHTSSLLVIV